MRVLELGDAAGGGPVVRRAAVKALVERDGRYLLLRTPATDDHKLPGGGIDAGETHEQALARELAEETGRALDRVDSLVLTVVERRRDQHEPGAVFEMTSSYYRVALTPGTGERDLDDYERDLDLTPVWVTAGSALAANEALLATGDAAPWTARETEVLRMIVAGEI